MTWWAWMVLGLVLLGFELFAVDAQFYLVFLGVSAALVGLAGMLGISVPEWAQWLAFATLSLFFFFTFRRTLYRKIRSGAICEMAIWCADRKPSMFSSTSSSLARKFELNTVAVTGRSEMSAML